MNIPMLTKAKKRNAVRKYIPCWIKKIGTSLRTDYYQEYAFKRHYRIILIRSDAQLDLKDWHNYTLYAMFY